MDKRLEKAINEQLVKELYSAYLYLSMAAYLESQKLAGFSHWMKMQAQEECQHAMKFFDFLNRQGCRVLLEAIDKPPTEFLSAEDIFEKTLKHEQKVSGLIKDLQALAKEVNDQPACTLLEWFVLEQIEEERTPANILNKIKQAISQPDGILAIDKELLGRRQPV